MSNCINLKKRFGKDYRVKREESYYADHGEHARKDDPWLQIIPCRRGSHIFPWGGKMLAVSLARRSKLAGMLLTLGGELLQDGDDGQTVGFDVSLFEDVAKVMRPHKRRKWSQEQKEAAAERLRQFRLGSDRCKLSE